MHAEMNLEEMFLFAARIMADDEPGPMCCAWETLESRIGACDGGERCRNKATKVVDGVPYCTKHGSGL